MYVYVCKYLCVYFLLFFFVKLLYDKFFSSEVTYPFYIDIIRFTTSLHNWLCLVVMSCSNTSTDQ